MADRLDFKSFQLKRRAGRCGVARFARAELQQLLSVYAFRVAAGDWKDYALDHVPGMAVFSIFRHSFDAPLYSVVKIQDRSGAVEYILFEATKLCVQSASLQDITRHLSRILRIVK
jgi:Protein of unknown function (DUF2794)